MTRLTLACGLLFLALAQGVMAQASFSTLEGRPVTLQNLLEADDQRPLVLVVWCSLCGSCRAGEPYLERFGQQWNDKVRVFAVTPHPADTPDKVKEYLTKNEVSLQVLRDPGQSVLKAFNIDRTTTALLFDTQGRLQYIGPLKEGDASFAADAVNALLSGQPVKVPNRPLKGCTIPPL